MLFRSQTIYAGFPPIITGVHAAFFVTLRDTYAIEDGETLPAFLNIHYAYFDDLVIDEDSLHVEMDAVGRVGHNYLTSPKKVHQ